VNNIFPMKLQGTSIAIFVTIGAVSGMIAPALMGWLADIWDTQAVPEREGYLLGSALLFSYIFSIPFLAAAGTRYNDMVNKINT